MRKDFSKRAGAFLSATALAVTLTGCPRNDADDTQDLDNDKEIVYEVPQEEKSTWYTKVDNSLPLVKVDFYAMLSERFGLDTEICQNADVIALIEKIRFSYDINEIYCDEKNAISSEQNLLLYQKNDGKYTNAFNIQLKFLDNNKINLICDLFIVNSSGKGRERTALFIGPNNETIRKYEDNLFTADGTKNVLEIRNSEEPGAKRTADEVIILYTDKDNYLQYLNIHLKKETTKDYTTYTLIFSADCGEIFIDISENDFWDLSELVTKAISDENYSRFISDAYSYLVEYLRHAENLGSYSRFMELLNHYYRLNTNSVLVLV